MTKKLIAFYSRAGENYVNGLIKTLKLGNTEMAAGIIAELTGADTFKIEQQTPIRKFTMNALLKHSMINRITSVRV